MVKNSQMALFSHKACESKKQVYWILATILIVQHCVSDITDIHNSSKNKANG